jgi:hypothetical protein
LSDRVTPSHGVFGFFHGSGGSWGWNSAGVGDAGRAGTGTDPTGRGTPGTSSPGCGAERGWWSGLGDSTAVATHFDQRVERDPHTGETTRLTVVALDASNHPVPNYTGTVRLADTDPASGLPADYTFTAADRGRHTFAITPATAGSQTVTATDAADASITGTVTLDVTPAAAATHSRVLARREAATGAATDVVVIALDASNRPVRNYAGTVHLTSTGGTAVLPADYTFAATDQGVYAFTVTFNTAGSQTLTATDTAASAVTGSVTVTVGAAADAGGGHGLGFGDRHHGHRG